MNIDVFFTRKVHRIVIGIHLIRELMKCFQTRCDAGTKGSYSLRVPRARARNTCIFLARGLWLCVVFAPCLALQATDLTTLLFNPVSEHELCCNDFSVFDGTLCTLDIDAMKNKTFWTQFVGRYSVCYKLTVSFYFLETSPYGVSIRKDSFSFNLWICWQIEVLYALNKTFRRQFFHFFPTGQEMIKEKKNTSSSGKRRGNFFWIRKNSCFEEKWGKIEFFRQGWFNTFEGWKGWLISRISFVNEERKFAENIEVLMNE